MRVNEAHNYNIRIEFFQVWFKFLLRAKNKSKILKISRL